MKFLFVTGSRSECYIKPILDILKKKNLKPIFVLQICIYESYGYTLNEIRRMGIK